MSKDRRDVDEVFIVKTVDPVDGDTAEEISRLFPETVGVTVLPDADRVMSIPANMDIIVHNIVRLHNEYREAGGGTGAWVTDHFGVTLAVLIVGPLVQDGGGPPKFIVAMTEKDLDLPYMPTSMRQMYTHYVNKILPNLKAGSN